MQAVNTDQMTFTDAKHMPIVKEYARQIGLVETIGSTVLVSKPRQPRWMRR